MMWRIARRQAAAGFADDARRTVAGLPDDPDQQSRTLAAIAGGEARVGLFAEALRTASTITEDDDDVEALTSIAAAQVAAGAIDDARLTLAHAVAVAGDLEEERLLDDIIEVQSGAGLLDDAMRALDALPAGTGFYRVHALVAIADAQAAAGHVDEAGQTLVEALVETGQIPTGSSRARSIGWIASAQGHASLSEEARLTFNSAVYLASMLADDRDETFRHIASEQARLGLIDAAGTTFSRITDPYHQVRALGSIATVHAEADDLGTAVRLFQGALSLADQIEDAYDRAQALRLAAHDQARVGMVADDRLTFAEALAAGRGSGPLFGYDTASMGVREQTWAAVSAFRAQ